MLLTLTLTGCSTVYVERYVERNVPIPKSLVYNPCEPYGAGDNADSLVRGFIENLGCIGQYRKMVDGVDVYNAEILSKNPQLDEETNEGGRHGRP